MHAQVYITANERPGPNCQLSKSAPAERSAGDSARFWAFVGRGEPESCWLWSGSLIGVAGYKYGQFALGRTRVYAHRHSYELAHGAIPRGLVVCHSCDVTACVNPAHLFLGSQGDNLRDASKKGHFRVPRPTAHKVTTEQLAEIDALLASGVLQVTIAAQYGVTRSWVCAYASGRIRQYDRPSATAMRKAS